MKETRVIMGMPITISLVIPRSHVDDRGELSPSIGMNGEEAASSAIAAAFNFFQYVDRKFSPYRENSEISQINRGEIKPENASDDMKEVFALSEQTKNESEGYFNIVNRQGVYDPSGLVKGWAINKASDMIASMGFLGHFVEAGGDIHASGLNHEGKPWKIGIKNPFCERGFVKIASLVDRGIATSGSYIRGDHIYNPKDKAGKIEDIVSLTVIGPNIYEADRFATAAFAMGKKGIQFLERMPGLEGYIIDKKSTATMTSGFSSYIS